MLKRINENGLELVYDVTGEKFSLLHLSNEPFNESRISARKSLYNACEIHVSGGNPNEHHGAKHYLAGETSSLRFVSCDERCNEHGRLIEVVQKNDNIRVITFYQFYDGIKAVRSYSRLENISGEDITLEYVSSFCLLGIDGGGAGLYSEKSRFYVSSNTWDGECQWNRFSATELGLNNVLEFSLKRITSSNTGTWSTKESLPCGIIENTETNNFTMWQIEHNGSWHSEISTIDFKLYLLLSGPTYNENNWAQILKPGEAFDSVPAAISFDNSLNGAVQQMTGYRRKIRRQSDDNKNLPVIFNDYMNCLMGDPTYEKELPLIDRAAEIGCEYYCIDAGWYDDGNWWDTIGEWVEAKTRFGGKLKELIKLIKSKGMKAGLWLEIECMGINSPMLEKTSPDWFFTRNGKRVIDHGRYQLDFTNPAVREFADSVIKRLVEEMGVDYIKMDYNIEAGPGTDRNGQSVGAGLLAHNRAYLKWLHGVFKKYPGLVIENCSSGGMRLDYAMLSEYSIQSTSDQTDYLKYAYIASNAFSALTPEQSACWSYPLKDASDEEVIFNMVNSLLMRIHQSGCLNAIPDSGMALIKEAIALYKSELRSFIANALPIFPLGFCRFGADNTAVGLEKGNTAYIAVWNIRGAKEITVPLNGKKVENAVQIYPQAYQLPVIAEGDTLKIRFAANKSARLIKLKYKN